MSDEAAKPTTGHTLPEDLVEAEDRRRKRQRPASGPTRPRPRRRPRR
jgi:hypothetical protein